jgi:hypothetical protein
MRNNITQAIYTGGGMLLTSLLGWNFADAIPNQTPAETAIITAVVSALAVVTGKLIDRWFAERKARNEGVSKREDLAFDAVLKENQSLKDREEKQVAEIIGLSSDVAVHKDRIDHLEAELAKEREARAKDSAARLEERRLLTLQVNELTNKLDAVVRKVNSSTSPGLEMKP